MGKALCAGLTVHALLTPAVAQPSGGGTAPSTISPQAGSTFPWETGLRVATYSAVNLYNGNLLTTIPIDAWPSFGPDMDFKLYHNSASAAPEAEEVEPGSGFSLGPGWSIAYGGRLVFDDPEEPTLITVVEDDGLIKEYELSGGNWIPPTGVYDTLEFDPDVDVPAHATDQPSPQPDPAWVLTRKNQWRRVYSADGRLLFHMDSYRETPLGIRVVYFPPDWTVEVLRNKLAQVRDMTFCRRLEFNYDDDGRLEDVREQYVENRQWCFLYEEYDHDEQTGSRLVRIVGPFQQMENYGCADADEDEDVHRILIEYDSSVEEEEPGPHRIAELTDKAGNAFTYEYDADGRLAQVTDPQPSSGTPCDQTFAYVEVTTTSPHPFRTTVTDRRNKNWAYTFSNNGNWTELKNPLNQTRKFHYDSARNRDKFTNELNKDWNATHDSSGNLLTLTDPLGHKWTWTYDGHNNVTSITPPLNTSGGSDTSKQVLFEYEDEYLDEEEEPQIADPTHLTKIIEPDDGEENEAAETILTYYHVNTAAPESVGELESVMDANGVPTRFEYVDHDGVLKKWIEGPDLISLTAGHPVENSYTIDKGGRLENTDGYNGSAGAGHNDENDPTTASCLPCESNTPLSPCQGSAGSQPEPPNPHLPIPVCHKHVPMPACAYPCIVNTFDAMGHPLTSNYPLEAVYQVTNWDSSPIEVDWEYATRAFTHVYDERYLLRSLTLTTTEPNWTPENDDQETVRAYTFEYDENGNLKKVIDENDATDTLVATTAYVYDNASRLTQVKVNTESTPAVAYTLYATGRVQYADYANGTRVEYTYDDAQRLDKIRHKYGTTLLLELDYSWTPDGLVSSIVNTTGSGSYTVSFDYDKRNRLLREWTTNGTANAPVPYDLTYTYDQLGNRLTKTDAVSSPDIITTYHYDLEDPEEYETKNNRLMYYTVEQGEDTLETVWYGYNRGGQAKLIVRNYPQSTDPDRYHILALQYNLKQQLWLVRGFTLDGDDCGEEGELLTPTFAREFRYDNDRQRYLVRERDPAYLTPLANGEVWHDYVGDAIYKDLEVATSGNVGVNAYYTRGYNLAALTDGGNARQFFHGDMLGTTRLLTNSGGSVSTALSYTAFGEVLNPPTSGVTRYGYAGDWGYQNDGLDDPDREIGLLHVGARYYDPASGRFVMRDPIGIAGGLNVYAYVGNSPTNTVDPTGMFSYADLTIALMIYMPRVVATVHMYQDAIAIGFTIAEILANLDFGEAFDDHTHDNSGTWDGKRYIAHEENDDGTVSLVHCHRQPKRPQPPRWIPRPTRPPPWRTR